MVTIFDVLFTGMNKTREDADEQHTKGPNMDLEEQSLDAYYEMSFQI
jgi:hypothetical protein